MVLALRVGSGDIVSASFVEGIEAGGLHRQRRRHDADVIRPLASLPSHF